MLDYGVKDIKTLEGIEAIRLRPGMLNFSFQWKLICDGSKYNALGKNNTRR